MAFLMWVVIGMITGWLAGLVLKSKGFGPIRYSLVGVVGALAGGLLTAPIFGVPYAVNSSNLISLLVAFLSAIALTVTVRMFRGRGDQSWSQR